MVSTDVVARRLADVVRYWFDRLAAGIESRSTISAATAAQKRFVLAFDAGAADQIVGLVSLGVIGGYFRLRRAAWRQIAQHVGG